MSDEPERVFSIAGHLLSPRRRKIKGESVEQLLCLRSWSNSKIIILDQTRIGDAIAACVGDDDDDEDVIMNTNTYIHHSSDHSNDEN
jgi:hypothetical protein